MGLRLPRLVIVVLATLLSMPGCTSSNVEAPAASQPETPVGTPAPPPVPAVLTTMPPFQGETLALLEARTGSVDVGVIEVRVGDLWILGQCRGSDLVISLDPVVSLEISCDQLGNVPFLNQVTVSDEITATLSVVADDAVLWTLRVEQTS